MVHTPFAITASHDRLLRLVDFSKQQLRCTLFGHKFGINCCAMTPDALWAVSGDQGGIIRIWNLTRRQQTYHSSTESLSHKGAVTCCAVHCNHEPLAEAPTDSVAASTAAAMQAPHVWFVTGSLDRTLAVWDCTSSVPLLHLDGHGEGVSCVAISPNGSVILSGDGGHVPRARGEIRMWDRSNGTCVQKLAAHSGGVSSIEWANNGRWFCSGCIDQTVRIFDSEGALRRALDGHTGPVRDVLISNSGRWLMSSSDDETMRVWDAEAGRQVVQLVGHEGPVTGIAISVDDTTVCSVGTDKTTRLWDMRHIDSVIQRKYNRRQKERQLAGYGDIKHDMANATHDETAADVAERAKGHTNEVRRQDDVY